MEAGDRKNPRTCCLPADLQCSFNQGQVQGLAHQPDGPSAQQGGMEDGAAAARGAVKRDGEREAGECESNGHLH